MANPSIPDDIYSVPVATVGHPRVLIVTADDVEDLEFFYPYYRFAEAGFAIDVATPKGKDFKGKHGLPMAQSLPLSSVSPANYDVMFIPGGKAPAKLRKDDAALALTRAFVQTGKPVVSICHGPQLLAAADVIRGKKIAAWPECETEVREAGGVYQNSATVVDGQFTTARWPADLPKLMAQVMQSLGQRQQTQRAA